MFPTSECLSEVQSCFSLFSITLIITVFAFSDNGDLFSSSHCYCDCSTVPYFHYLKTATDSYQGKDRSTLYVLVVRWQVHFLCAINPALILTQICVCVGRVKMLNTVKASKIKWKHMTAMRVIMSLKFLHRWNFIVHSWRTHACYEDGKDEKIYFQVEFNTTTSNESMAHIVITLRRTLRPWCSQGLKQWRQVIQCQYLFCSTNVTLVYWHAVTNHFVCWIFVCLEHWLSRWSVIQGIIHYRFQRLMIEIRPCQTEMILTSTTAITCKCMCPCVCLCVCVLMCASSFSIIYHQSSTLLDSSRINK